MGTKYIRNTDDATIVCKIPSDKNASFVFRAKKYDRRNDVLLSNGFTAISEEDLALLEAESSTYKYYKDAGKLTLADNLPEEAMSPEQLIDMLRSEIEILKSVDSNAELANAKIEIEQMLLTMEKQQAMIDALQEQIADMEIPAVDLEKGE